MVIQLKKIVPVCFFAISVMPFIAYADVNIVNNTDIFGTASLSTMAGCSSDLGDRGIIKHHSTIVIPQYLFNAFCTFGCTASIYASKNCGGKVMGTAEITPGKNITKMTNYDKEHFEVQGGGDNVIINPVKKGFMDWIKTIF